MSRPDRKVVQRIAAVESVIAGVKLDDVLGTCRTKRVTEARARAMRRIIEETACSRNGLALVWGCGFETVRRAISGRPQKAYRKPVLPKPTYDVATIERLTSRHGPARTLNIISGQDEATNADLAAWSRIGAAL